MMANTHTVASVDSLKKAVLTNSPQLYNSEKPFNTHEEQVELARIFTYAMHGHSMAPALVWPELIDLSKYKLLLDIGGGSGAHAIGATLKWSQLQAIVLDLLPVCEVAQEFAMRYGLQNRIKTRSSDMWKDPFPSADIHFYADIYHDWLPEQGQFLTQKSFDSLPAGGRIIIHEMLYNDNQTGPFTVAASNLQMLVTMEGQQYSGRELSEMLAEAGFTDIEVKPTLGYWSIVTGCKP
jgi:ubiquinone/menaquinone biosynthesis C-methylase UbiE